MPKLFEPIQVGRLTLSHRVVLPPLTRLRADDDYAPLPAVKDYYVQRAKIPGTFLIAEGTGIASQATGYPHFPELWSEKQIAAWKEVADAVHAQGSFIYLQILSLGRIGVPAILKSKGHDYVAPSAIPVSPESEVPRELTLAEIEEYIELYGVAAENAIFKAGFDGVEIHGANGGLTEQFLQDLGNARTDAYGGSIERRAKYALDIVERVSRSVGQDRVGFRVSPWNKGNGLGMADPKPTYSYLVSQLKQRFPALAYLHVIEPRVDTNWFDKEPDQVSSTESNDFLRAIWAPKPFIRAGGFNRESGIEEAEKGDLIAYGRWYMANPDLPTRILKDIPFNAYDRSTFYMPGDGSGKGYTDYPFVASVAA